VLATAALTAAAPAVVPTRQSVLGQGESRAAVRPPGALMQRTVVAHTAPPRAPVPFERQLAVIESNGGRPPTRGELELLQHAAALTPVRLVSPRAAPSAAPAAAAQGPATRSLGERERALQQSALPSAPRATLPPLPATSTSAYVLPGEPLSPASPVLRSDRPPSAQQHPSEAPPLAVVPGDPPRPADRPSSLPVYHFPSPEAAPPAHAATGGHPQETNRIAPSPATPHVATPAPPPPAHPSPPPHSQSSTEPRESAPHGDRDSRERVLR
jgi:hypothetical protein